MSRNGDGNKKALHTTTISGRSDADDPRSLVVFYRSHLGGFGDLLQMLLRKRSPKHPALTVQSDLSTVNLVADETLNRHFTFRYAGCKPARVLGLLHKRGPVRAQRAVQRAELRLTACVAECTGWCSALLGCTAHAQAATQAAGRAAALVFTRV